MGFYEELGLRTVINASGTLTRLGGSRMAPETLAAMAEAAAGFVPVSYTHLTLPATPYV